MKLTQALNKLGKIVGKSTYRVVRVQIMSHSKEYNKKGEFSIEWEVQSGNTVGVYSGSTLKEALQEIKKNLKPKKKRYQNVEVKEEVKKP